MADNRHFEDSPNNRHGPAPSNFYEVVPEHVITNEFTDFNDANKNSVFFRDDGLLKQSVMIHEEPEPTKESE
jgi:hypothetical protein